MTSLTRTVVDCARRLPFAEALAIADSALRHGDVDAERLFRPLPGCTERGRSTCVVLPQVAIRVTGKNLHPDVVDVDLRLALEADS